MALIFPFQRQKPHKTREGKIVLTMQAHNIDTILDVGANNGRYHDEMRRGGFKDDIISLEPLPFLQQELREKAGKDPRWIVLPPVALGEKNGETEITVSQASDLSSLLPATGSMLQALPRTEAAERITVPMKTLDSLFEELNLQNKNVFLKLDTQGYEMHILKSGEKALKCIAGIQVEMSLLELYEGETLFDEMIVFLKARCFYAHMLFETTFSRKLNRQLQVDGVFYRDQK